MKHFLRCMSSSETPQIFVFLQEFSRKTDLITMNFREYKGIDYAQIADEILAFWKENKIFEQSVTTREGQPSFTFYEGPPSANGTPGIHHVMARTIKDIFCRYQTLKGKQVKRKGGWDTHGLPIELQVEKELGITKDDIGRTISIEDYNQKCRETVMRFTDQWLDMTERMGYWVDMDDPYITYKNEYIESVWWLLKQLYTKGLLYKGYTVQPYSPAAGTGLSSHELNMPGTYKDVKDTTIVAMFKVKHSEKSAFLFESAEEDLRILAWTTTPWTLPANCGLTVGEKIDYVKIKTFNPYTYAPVSVVLAKALVGKYFSEKAKDLSLDEYKAGDKLTPWHLVQEFKGKDLLEIRYEQLIPAVTNHELDTNAFRVIAGDFVTTEDGTGIVHTASVFGADDFRVCQQNGVPSVMVKDETGKEVPIVDRKGKFVSEVGNYLVEKVQEHHIKTHKSFGKDDFYVKNYLSEDEKQADYKTTDEIIAIFLKSDNKAFKVERYEHTYPHCWRTDKPVLYYPLDSWFIRTTAMKDKLIHLNNTINWKPESTGTGRFGNWLENLVDWNLSRSRFWGTPLPVWRSEDGEEVCIGSVEELRNCVDMAVKAGFMESNPLTPPLTPPQQGGGQEKDSTSQQTYDFSSLSVGGQLSQGHPFFHTNPEKWKIVKAFVREMRKNSTPAEDILWQEVRGKKILGLKFRRQHAIEDYIVDFVNLEYGLVIEVDGSVHSQQQEYDQYRTEFLEYHGFTVIRFSNDEVENNIVSVINTIKDAISELQLAKNKQHNAPLANVDKTNENISFTPLSTGEMTEDVTFTPLSTGEMTEDVAFTPLPTGEGLGVGFDLHRPYVDNLVLVSPSGKPMYRETDLIDVWFDSGAMPYAQWHYPFENQDIFEQSFPADFISEGVDQTRGWFFTLHAISTMVSESVSFKNVVSTGLVLDKNGEKMSKRKGNVINPFEALPKYGADPVRWYMITNSNPWENLKFNLDGITEVQRKFFGTLYNTYTFFALYANLDNYEVNEFDRLPREKLSELDRWILSKLNTLVKEVDEAYADYEPTKAGRAIQDFVCDHLSNWYVRLSRRRFWKGEMTEDKQAAYETLQHCLVAVSQLMSPIAPFFADWLYKNMTDHLRAKAIEKQTPFRYDSVHLSMFHPYEADWVDAELEASMDLAQRVSSLVHSLRKGHKIKVRQPLSKILIPVLSEHTREQIRHVEELIKAEVNVKTIEYVDDDSGVLSKKVKPNFKALGPKYGAKMKEVAAVINGLTKEEINQLDKEGSLLLSNFSLLREDVEILTEDLPGWIVANESGLTVALDITITDELRQEGIARDFVNRIQNLRKDSGMEVTDKIRISLKGTYDAVNTALEANQDYVCTETQALSLHILPELTNAVLVEMDEFLLDVKIEVV